MSGGHPNWPQPSQSRQRSFGFTLVELLVVIAIILLLISLVSPSLRGSLARAREIQCFNQLRQVGVLCIAHARDNKGRLPRGNAYNPATFLLSVGQTLDAYMRTVNMPSNIWYCPTLTLGLSASQSQASGNALITADVHWLKYVDSASAPDEFRIGYFYLGGLKRADEINKFVKEFDATRLNNPRQELVFDYCSSWEVAPPRATEVPAGRWNDFPHPGPHNPGVQNLLLMDGHVERRTRVDMTLGYRYYHPRRVYW